MGGDGGVIASNRLYLRGAGKACHTADRERHKKTQEEEHQECRETMRMCALKGEALVFQPENHQSVNGNSQKSGLTSTTSDNSIVVCPYGKLYEREAAIEALLRRKLNERSENNGSDEEGSALGSYIRGLKDLHELRFHLVPKSTKNHNSKIEYIPTCPITGEELNGVQPAFAIIKSKKKSTSKSDSDNDSTGKVNVLSERAIKEMGIENLQLEYGPFEQKYMIRLAPPFRELQTIKEKLSVLREEESLLKKSKKKSKKISTNKDKTQNKKRKHEKPIVTAKKNKPTQTNQKNTSSDAVSTARSNVASAVASNAALSSIFQTKKSALSSKERNDNLFAR